MLDFGAATGRGAMQSLVRGLLALDDASDAQAGLSGVGHAIGDGLIDRGDALFLKDLVDVPMSLADRATYEAMDNATRAGGRRHVVSRLVERASRRQPRLLSVEDIHWSDGSTLNDLAGLSATVAQCPAVLVLTARPAGHAFDESWRAAADAENST